MDASEIADAMGGDFKGEMLRIPAKLKRHAANVIVQPLAKPHPAATASDLPGGEVKSAVNYHTKIIRLRPPIRRKSQTRKVLP